LTAAVNPENSTNQQPISPVTVLSVFAVLITVVAGGISLYFPIASYLKNQQIKANESEAKKYLKSLNYAQKIYYIKYNRFSNSIENLGLGIKRETDNYTYYTRPSTVKDLPSDTITEKQIADWVLKYEINQNSISSSSNQVVVNYAISRQENLRSYVGFVSEVIPSLRSPVDVWAILCQASNPGTIYPAIPTYQTGQLVCAAGTRKVK
jgi:type IV pilus assembly protein PilA